MILYISQLESEFHNKIFRPDINDLPKRGTLFLNKNYDLIISSKKISLGFKIIGKLNALIEYQCIRCLKKTPFNTDISINLTLIKNKRKKKKHNINVNDIVYIERNKNYFSIDRILADMIELSKPYNPLCKKECKGLCSHCGQNLNKKKCICTKNRINSSFEELKNLQVKKN